MWSLYEWLFRFGCDWSLSSNRFSLFLHRSLLRFPPIRRTKPTNEKQGEKWNTQRDPMQPDTHTTLTPTPQQLILHIHPQPIVTSRYTLSSGSMTPIFHHSTRIQLMSYS